MCTLSCQLSRIVHNLFASLESMQSFNNVTEITRVYNIETDV